MIEYFRSNHKEIGFTLIEALEKKAEVDKKFGVEFQGCNWNPAFVVRDTEKRSGFKVVIMSKDE